MKVGDMYFSVFPYGDLPVGTVIRCTGVNINQIRFEFEAINYPSPKILFLKEPSESIEWKEVVPS